jgi:hypothetical protein
MHIFLFDFIWFLRNQEWLECLSKIRCNKNEKNIYECISQCQQALSSKLGLEGGFKLLSLITILQNFLSKALPRMENSEKNYWPMF